MLKKIIYIVVATMFLFNLATIQASADNANKNTASTYEEPYGMAGCGLWTYVIKDKTRGAQLGLFALKTFVFQVQISAITTGTSNCVEKRPDYALEEQKVFIRTNLASLNKEASQGQGEHLSALSEVFGCPNNSNFAKFSRDRYEKIFSDQNPDKVLENYLNEVKSDKELSKSCIRAG